MLQKLRTYLEMIRFPHTVFALPFAFMGAVLAAGGIPAGRTLFWILVAMVGARSGAMGMNRFADRHLDALNPRTRDRALPQGRIAPGEALLFVAGSFAIFLLAAWMLNPLCLALTGRVALPALALGAAVVFWVAGFDILYALMDIEFDRRTGLFSIPARLGAEGGMWAARLFHALTAACLGSLIPLLHLGAVYALGLLLAVGLLCYEHWLLHRHGLAKLDVAFFNVNGALSIGLFLFTLGDLLLG
jgi:4-hydroxybenzoate polyprenyltransferase